MIPKKPDKIYKTVSEDLNIQQKLIEDLVEFYYKELRTKMSLLSHTRINVEGLGHMVVKSQIVKNATNRIEKGLIGHDTSTFNAYHNKRGMEEKLILLKNIAVKLVNQYQERKKFKDLKNESSTESNLGE